MKTSPSVVQCNIIGHGSHKSQNADCTCSIFHNASFRTEMCTFLFWMLHCGIWDRCILGFVNIQVNCNANSWKASSVSLYIYLFHKDIQYIPRNMHTDFALLCFVVVIHWLIFPYPSGLLHWHCGNLTIAPVPAKQPWWIWINTSCEFIMNDCITTTKQSTTKPCAYFLGYTVHDWSCKKMLYAFCGCNH